MRFQLVRPVVSKGSSIPRFVKRIPSDIKDRMVGRTLVIPLGNGTVAFRVTASTQSIRFSLGTADPSQARIRQAEAVTYVEQYFSAVRDARPVQLTHRQVTALAGEFYRSWAAGPDTTQSLAYAPATGEFFTGEDHGFDEAELMAAAQEALAERAESAGDDYFLTSHLPDIDKRLAELGIPEVTPTSRFQLAKAFHKQLLDGLATNARIAGGDYSPDANLSKFPSWEPPVRERTDKPKEGVSLTGLVDAWWVEAKAVGKSLSTYESYANTIRLFSAFIGHDDATRVTPEDVIKYKDHRLSAISPRTGKPISPTTIKGSDLTAFKSVFDWAVSNRKLPSNPASGVSLSAQQ